MDVAVLFQGQGKYKTQYIKKIIGEMYEDMTDVNIQHALEESCGIIGMHFMHCDDENQYERSIRSSDDRTETRDQVCDAADNGYQSDVIHSRKQHKSSSRPADDHRVDQ